MNNTVIKQYVLISIIPFLFSCASRTIDVVCIEAPEKTIPKIIGETICSLTSLPLYSSEMKSGDEFLVIISPGFAFSELEELSFVYLSGNSFIGNLEATDKAYRFAMLVNKLIVPGHSYQETGILLGDYFSGITQQHPVKNLNIYDLDDMNSFKFTSPTYNDDFYLTTINPFSTHLTDSWTKFNKTVNQIESIESLKKSI
jgi:hypothetical protein